ncbi:hypothetical protein MKW98_005425 [Papaver atlanticum]|uniref:phytol kinase n=1 Tax=Papaver atlanticum TaxID=357466 RepID=A0AAD4RWQ3_9MAGN|nr:hypothetical protein MKW98_005425 [Papaver atlanticum]
MESIMSHRASILSFTLATTSLPSKMSILQQPTTRTPLLNFCPNLQNQTRAFTTKDIPSLLFHHNPSNSSSFKVYSSLNLFSSDQSNMILQDVGATGLVMVGAYSLVLVFDNLTKNQVIQQNLSRKLVHVLSGLLFLSCWPIFSNSAEARYFAAVVPFVNCARLILNGLSLTTDAGLVKSVTREGNPRELLKGPLCYVLILILSAVAYWRDSPVGIMSLAMMCGGDGVADIIGRRYGKQKLPYNQQKSWAGSISMFTFGFLISIGMLKYFTALGYFELDWSSTMGRVALVSLVATIVESLPTTEVLDDNLSVPLSTMLVAVLMFG